MKTTEAREELRRKLEGYMTDSIGAALEYLDSEEADDLIVDAELEHLSSVSLLRELTGVSVYGA